MPRLKDGIAKLTTGPAAKRQKQQKAIGSNLNIPAEMNTESTSNSNYVNSLTEMKLMIANLEVFWAGLNYWNCFFILIIFRPKIKRFKEKWKTSN
jgi:hypothetical protein